MIPELNDRSRQIFRLIVDTYLSGGEPVGSRTLAQQLGLSLSAATIRNVMADLEDAGLLYAPHTSAGRMPTTQGLRFYIDGLMQIGSLTDDERQQIETQCMAQGQSVTQVLERAGTLLAGLSSGAGVVIAPKTDKPVRQIQFVKLDEGRVLVVLVMQDGMVENRVMHVESDIPQSALIAAGNYLSERLHGQTIAQAKARITQDIRQNRAQLDAITAHLIEKGLALPLSDTPDGHIIIRGQSRLLQDVRALEDLERARQLFAALEEQETAARLMDATQDADGIQIFIGTESQTFQHAGWSMVMSPARTAEGQMIGAIGVIGPTRINYGRIIPIVDYTSKVMGKLLGES
ncbi:MAG: heat-inducible transcriptional repressor HrcA [Micavibrio aeruginosavorus]|nr:heat-inducible transcriptional repressor HrcA [Micavibrio aeruginosavorus]